MKRRSFKILVVGAAISAAAVSSFKYDMKTKRKLLLVVLTGICFLASLQAQQAVVSAGGIGKSGNLTVNWSIGEVMTETYVNASIKLTQGVQQPQITVKQGETATPEMRALQISAYPNPAKDVVILSIAELGENQLTLKIFEPNGKLLRIEQITENETRISVADFATGMYLLQITDKKNNVQTFKIVVSR